MPDQGGQAGTEITKEMLDAGVAAFELWEPSVPAEQVVAYVYSAMRAALPKGAQLSRGKGP